MDVVIAPAVSDSLAVALATWAARPGRAILAAAATTSAACSLPVFRTGPDSAGRAGIAARRDTLAKTAIRSASDTAAEPRTSVQLWHHDLERFGARQLSDRYALHYTAPMSSEAWEGWMAVKIAWEASLRAQDGDIASALARGAFDGHKGAALRFGPGDRVLRQPLFIVGPASGAGVSDGGVPLPPASRARIREIPWPADEPGAAGHSTANFPTRCIR
jgi:hypothetical protein